MSRGPALAVVGVLVVGVVVVGILGALVGPSPPAAARGQLTTYLTGLSWPIALAFSPDGRIFYAERNTGGVRIVEGGTLLPTPFYTLPNTATAGERGLLGLALDPGFPANPWVYAYQTYNDVANGTVYNRIVRIQASGNVGVSDTVILRMPPLSGATNHNGGVIAFGPDGKLYAVVGENANIPLAQDLTSPMGKVLRMNPDGSPPTDNPFYGSPTVDNLIYTYGHRNMFGFAFHPFTDRAYVTENGPGCNDEVNLLEAGRNYGWGPAETCSTPPPPPNNTNQDGPNPVLPIWWWGGTICPTNAAVYGGPYFPAWQGDLFMGECNFRRFHRLHLVPPGYDAVASDEILLTAPNIILDVEAGPDGAIWLTTPTTIYRYVDVSQGPIASFTATPNPVDLGVPVSFDASASFDPDGFIASYAWDFGDSTTGTGVTTTHVYAAPGTYRAVLTVVDNESYAANLSTDIVVRTPPQRPVASFTATPNPVDVGVTVTFDASASSDPDGVIVSYEWDFGDAAQGTGVTAGHAYASPGTFTVLLTVTDNSSLQDTNTTQLVVNPPNLPPTASFTTSPNPVDVGVTVTFDGSASSDPDGTIVAYDWDFGDGGIATGPTTSHAYASPGTFTVILAVTDNRSSEANATTQVVVNGPNEPPVAAFTASQNPANVGVPVTFDATGSFDPDGTIVSYLWDFGDGDTGSGATTTHAFAAPGSFTVALTVTDNGAAEDSESILLRVNTPPVAQFSATPTTSFIGVPVEFDASASFDSDGTIVAWLWDFGDSSFASGIRPSHVFSQKGTFTVTLRVIDDRGSSGNASNAVAIVNRAPQILSAVPAGGTVDITEGQTTDLSVVAEDPDLDPLVYTWEVDGTVLPDAGSSLSFRPAAPGVYVVNVTVSDGALSDSHAWIVIVSPSPVTPIVIAAGVAIVAALFVLAILAVLAFSRRRRRDQGPSPPPREP